MALLSSTNTCVCPCPRGIYARAPTGESRDDLHGQQWRTYTCPTGSLACSPTEKVDMTPDRSIYMHTSAYLTGSHCVSPTLEYQDGRRAPKMHTSRHPKGSRRVSPTGERRDVLPGQSLLTSTDPKDTRWTSPTA